MPWVVTGACFVTEHRIVIHVKISYGLLLNIKMKKRFSFFYAFCYFTSLLQVLSNKPRTLSSLLWYVEKRETFIMHIIHSTQWSIWLKITSLHLWKRRKKHQTSKYILNLFYQHNPSPFAITAVVGYNPYG